MDIGSPFLWEKDLARFEFLRKKLPKEHALVECVPHLMVVREVVGSF